MSGLWGSVGSVALGPARVFVANFLPEDLNQAFVSREGLDDAQVKPSYFLPATVPADQVGLNNPSVDSFAHLDAFARVQVDKNHATSIPISRFNDAPVYAAGNHDLITNLVISELLGNSYSALSVERSGQRILTAGSLILASEM